jgi:hypothetical protein
MHNNETNDNVEQLEPYSVFAAKPLLQTDKIVVAAVLKLHELLSQLIHFNYRLTHFCGDHFRLSPTMWSISPVNTVPRRTTSYPEHLTSPEMLSHVSFVSIATSFSAHTPLNN